MIKLAKRQMAHQPHVCDDCGKAIGEGQAYDRIAQFESWKDVGYEGDPSPTFSEQSDPYVQQEIWKKVMRSKEVLILKVHARREQCIVDDGEG